MPVPRRLNRRQQAEFNVNYKSQNPNNKQIIRRGRNRSASGGPNLHIILEKENSKYVWVIEYWNLRFACNLVLGIWDFRMRISKQAEDRNSYVGVAFPPASPCPSASAEASRCRAGSHGGQAAAI